MKMLRLPPAAFGFAALLLVLGSGCRSLPRPGAPEPRKGDEIVIAGQFFHTGTPVVLWLDKGGYDAYRVERRFGPFDKAEWQPPQGSARDLKTPNRYGIRSVNVTQEQEAEARSRGWDRTHFTPEQLEQVRGGGWDLPLLQKVVDQFVIHFDVCGVSRTCFKVLQDDRDLSVHFMLDLDGTIYQTLDLKERAWHATISNDRSIGIEIANMGAYPAKGSNPFKTWYKHETNGTTVITLPPNLGDGGIRTKGFVGHPSRPEPVRGVTQGDDLVQYDFTPEQYAALARLTATLCTVFPKIKCSYPVDGDGKLINSKLPQADWEKYQGVLGHFHVQANKNDPGPAFQWDKVIGNAQGLMRGGQCQPAPRESDETLKRKF